MLKQKILNCFDRTKADCAFVIKNLQTNESAAYQEDLVVPSASLIKVPIMAETMRQVKEKKLSLDQRLVVNDSDKVPFSVVSILDSGNTYSLRDLLTLMIVHSDNTATNIIIDLIGMENVNHFLQNLGFQNTILQRKMMDFEARKQNRENYTTVKEMAKFLEMLYMGKIVDKQYSDLMLEIMKKQEDMGMMCLELPDNIIIARKSGDLENLNHDIGIVYLKHCAYIFSVFIWNAESNNFSRITLGRIAKVVYDYFTAQASHGIPDIRYTDKNRL